MPDLALQRQVESMAGASASQINKASMSAPENRRFEIRCRRPWQRIEESAHVDEDRECLAIVEGEDYRGVAPQQTGRWIFDRPVSAVEPPQDHEYRCDIGEFAAILS